jgi:outer membrane protein assembly factor BamB/tRNA A-37 threonylcarbamoyl transferase component Bud32
MADSIGDQRMRFPDQPRRDATGGPTGPTFWAADSQRLPDPRSGPSQALNYPQNPSGGYMTGVPQHPLPADTPTSSIQQGHFQLAPGTTLQNGRYVVEEVVGQGGMGHVYRVLDTHLARRRALKEMIPQMGDPEAELMNYRRETQMLLNQNHPGIPQIFDSFIEHRRAYIVLEFIPGDNLEQRLRQAQGFISQEQVGEWMLQLCHIVGFLHSQRPPIIFRDIKPNNIILTPDGRIVLVDFGIAKMFVPDEEHTNVGTNGYAPPEQYKRQAEPRSDIYSIGATMHHLLTRADPRKETPFTFHERMPRKLNPAISAEMEAVIMKCVQGRADDRYQSCEELEFAIESALGLGPLDDTSHFRAVRAGGGRVRATWAPALGPTGTLVGANAPLWSFETEEEIRATPCVGPNHVYIGSYDNNLYALDRRSGALAWKFATDGGICSSPALWHDLIIFGSEDFNVYALNAQTGAEVWRYRTWHHVRSSPRVYQDLVYIGSDDGYMHAIDPRTGMMAWRYQTYREVQSSAAYADGQLYFGSRDNYVYSVDAATGEKKWGLRTNGPVISAPCVVDDYLYIGSYDFAIYCLEAKSGWRAWEERTEKFIISSPTIGGDSLYIGSTDGHLYCLNRRTGRRLWRYRAGNQVNSTPAVVDGVVYFGSIDRSLYALDANDGRLRWRFETEGIVPGSPIVVDGVVYVGSADHRLYALPAAKQG